MSSVIIVYKDVKEAANQARSMQKNMKEYFDDGGEYKSLVNSLKGSDSAGYIGSSMSLVNAKMNKADEMAKKYARIAQSLDGLVSLAKDNDSAASSYIDTTCAGFLGERGFFDKIKDALYNGYVNFLDRLDGTGPLGQFIANAARKVTTWTGNAYNTVKSWFKNGNGRYLIDGIKSVLSVVSVCIGAAAAIAAEAVAAPVLGPLAVVGAVAAVIFAVTKIADEATNVYNTVKSFELEKDGNLTAARYYENVDSVSDAMQRYDLGGKTANTIGETYGKIHSAVETIAGVTSSVCNVAVGIGNAGLTTDPNTGAQIVDWSNGFKQTITNNFHDAGSSVFGTDWKRALSPKSWTGKVGSKLEYFNLPKGVIGTLGGLKVLDTGIKNVEAVYNVKDYIVNGASDVNDMYDFFTDSTLLVSNLTFFDALTSDWLDGLDNIVKIGKSAKETFGGSPMNAYESYLVSAGGGYR